jgi:hypothetical protein
MAKMKEPPLISEKAAVLCDCEKLVAAPTEEDKGVVEDCHNRLDSSSNIRQGGGIQDCIDAFMLLLVDHT